jgi:uncharacterized protein YndB with AHSA1/START domain
MTPATPHEADGAAVATGRTLPHPPEAVFAAFADPARLARWWGPAGFTNEFEVCDLRTGGEWRFVMRGPDGTRHPNVSRFREVDAPRRFVVEHLSAPRFTLTVVLTAADGGTRVSWLQVFESAEIAARLRPLVEPANEQNLDRLAAEVARG